MARESKIAVYAALTGNLAIALTKFIAAAATGSSAMLSEAIHSTVDTGDQLLLLVGMRRSELPPDREHPFGHGKELYFWSLLVAVLLFGVGGGISAYEGILHILSPSPLKDPFWSYVVLGAAFVFESVSLGVGLHVVGMRRGIRGLLVELGRTRDPTTVTVIAEDAAALAGLVIAFVGIFLSHRFEAPVLDGIASILIGVLLGGVATWLIWQCRGLLVGAGVDRETARQLREIILSVDAVERACRPLTMYFGPQDVLLTIDVQFRPEASASEVAQSIDDIEKKIKQRYPFIKRIYIEAVDADATPARSEPGRGAGGPAAT